MPQPQNKDIAGLNVSEETTLPKGKNYLLVIGIDAYTHCPKLHNAVKDAKDIVSLLKQRFQFEEENTIELYDEEATKKNIYKAFQNLARQITSIDNLILYFSGHGEYVKLFKDGYWIPVEAEKEAVDQFLPNSEIRNILSAIPSHHTFLMVDSCFSGSLFAKNAARNIPLRKEKDPSRWGLTAGRKEIVTDGEPGQNSPFAKSILYQLENANEPIGVATLCDKVLEVVSANANQTPRGEPLKVEGHQGGQFVFHLRNNEGIDWEKALAIGSIEAFQGFLVQYPKGENSKNAEAKIKFLKGEALWNQILTAPESTRTELNKKLQLVRKYLEDYDHESHHDEALNIGELLEYKKGFLSSKNSEFALRRFIRRTVPAVSGADSIQKEAQRLLDNLSTEKEPEIILSKPKSSEITDKPKEEKKVIPPPKASKKQPERKKVPLGGKQSGRIKKDENKGFKKWLFAPILILVGVVLIWQSNLNKTDIAESNPPSEGPSIPTRQEAEQFLKGYSGETGIASFYDNVYHGKRTASGENYDKNKLTGAHKDLPYGTMVKVTRLDTKASVVVRINDRGPYIKGWIVEVSEAAAKDLGMLEGGTIKVKLEIFKEEEAAATPRVEEEPKTNSDESTKNDLVKTTPAETGSFTDTRDNQNQTYTWVRLKDGKKWMAENLNYNTQDSWCYEGKESNCNKYGRLYTWESAKKACPKGWRLPSDDEYREMFKFYGGCDDDSNDSGTRAYKNLIKGGTSGFSAQLGGSRLSDGSFDDLGDYGRYWSSSESDSSIAWYYFFGRPNSGLRRYDRNKSWGFSCRCIQD